MSVQKGKFARQELAFGKAGQRRIAASRIAIVGLGGMGSLIAQMLAYLGVVSFVLIDDDIVEQSNLNRLVGATPEDVRRKRSKVCICMRMIKGIASGARVTALEKQLRSQKAFEALCGNVDIIFGCVDNDGARLILTELAAAFNKVLIDAATQIINTGDFQEFGGRVIVARPGDFCLLCAGQIDLAVAQQELLSPQENRYRKKLGYGAGKKVADPAVISLNGIIASVAATEFLMLVTGLRQPCRSVTYRGMRAIFRESLDKKKDGCLICNSIAGMRENAGIERFLKPGLPADLPE